jgi:hypothetical protein
MTETPALSASLVAAAKELTNPPKARTAAMGQYSYTYADLASVLEHVRPVLAAHDLVVTQDTRFAEGRVWVYTTLLHASGESLTFGPLSGPMGQTWQNVGSAITYARRYALMAALCIAAEDEDDDARKAADDRDDGASAEEFTKLEGPKPVASDDDLKRWAAGIRDATEFVHLKSIADEINAHHLDEDSRQQLLDEWFEKRQGLGHA